MAQFDRYMKQNGKLDIWDMGPGRPVMPKPPAEPDAKLKGAELAAAQVEYEDDCERYKQALRDFNAARRAFTDWHETNGGPIKVELWGVDARHALDTEPGRYKLDLPKGAKPGAAQIEADQMAESEAENLNRARNSDPQFGQQRAIA